MRRRVLARVNGATDEDMELARQDDRLSDLLDQRGYGIGDEVWSNDLLCEAERVAGTRVSLLVVQHNGTDVSGVAVPRDVLWALGDR